MKKFTCILLCLILFFSFSFSTVSASEATSKDEHIEFIFEENLSDDLKAKIEAHLLGEPTNSNTRGILCTIFGHDLVTATTTKITHKVNSNAPRCLKETFKVEACEDCDYTTSTLMNSTYINCCS